MRDSSSWYQPLARDLSRVWPAEHAAVKPSLLCQVELGLRLLERLDPDHGAAGVYALLSGYPFATAMGIAATPEQQAMLAVGRHLLWRLRRGRQWAQALDTYQELPGRLRGYRIPAGGGPSRRVEPTVAGDRYALYDLTLSQLPDFDRRALPLAGPGPSRFTDRRRPAAVTIPEELCLGPASGHDLDDIPGATSQPLEVPLAELAATARWMDETEERQDLKPGSWSQRLQDMRLDIVSADGLAFLPSPVLTLSRLLHLVGMVGSGKSTLMTLIAVWAARKGLRTTLVVGDVAEQLALSALFRDLDLPAAPVLGATTREQHAGRLHRRLAARGQGSLLTHDDPGFDFLSTVCVVDALRGLEAAEPLRYADAPCTSLHPAGSEPTSSGGIVLPERYPAGRGQSGPQRRAAEDPQTPAHGCPIWSACPRHAVDRELVEALIWVANPASLLQSAVPQHLNQERLRHLELACMRSDIIIVDEVDRVQMQLDTAFAPSATLVVRGPESWLDRLHTHKIDELARQGRLQLSERDVQRWAAALEVVTTATNRLYGMLIDNDDLRTWADIEYFSAWTLQEKLLAEWYPLSELDATPPDGIRADSDVYDPGEEAQPGEPEPGAAATQPWAEHRQAVTKALDKFRDDPLGDHGPYHTDTDDLIRAANDLLHTLNEKGTRGRVRAVLDLLLRHAPILDGSLTQPDPEDGQDTRDDADTWGTEEWYERTATRLEFSLLLAVLHQRLDRITFLWPQVEAALHLDTSDNELSRRPPLDYAPLVPEAPMGNVLGFQYLADDPEPGAAADDPRSGTLRFFRCAGVGRELLLNLPGLGADPATGRPGPHVLLMSGTSWAGTSTRAHVLAPVGAVLKPQEEALKAIDKTSFHTWFLYDSDGNPLTLSGSKVETRPAILRQMVTQLGRSGPGQPSILDQELRQIADETRRRALLLVGSYREATTAADILEAMPRWRGRVKVLAADDADLDHAAPGDAGSNDTISQAAALRRGDLASFAEDPDAELLVAPLLAVERGHNILNKQRRAAFGTVIFLARPHPRPDDLSLAIFAINDWVTRLVRDLPGLEAGTFSKMVSGAGDLDAAARAFRREARKEWRRLLWRPYIYSRLNDTEKESFAWDQMVTIWQVIGRLVRGGVPARVVFMDAAFAPALAESTAPPPAPSTPSVAKPRRNQRRRTDDGLLIKLRSVLAPYFEAPAGPADPQTFTNPADPALVRTLYHPLYQALCRVRNMTPGATVDDPASSD
jgi:pPIWI RE three-gene island domain Z